MGSLPETPYSLLRRLGEPGPGREADWAAFVTTYGEVILRWCKRANLRIHDAEEVSQEILLKLYHGIRNYDRERGRFRAYLKTIVQHEVADFCRSVARRLDRPAGGEENGAVPQHADPATLADQLMEVFVADLSRAVFENVAKQVNPAHLAAVRRLLEDPNATPQSVAAELGVTLPTVYKIKSELKRRFEEELDRLDREGPAS